MTYIEQCPVGCGQDFSLTAIELTEGALRRCNHCGQLVSQCSEQRYWDSMQEFDCAEGTMPKEKAQARSFALHKKRLQRIARHIKRPLSALHLLDIGCSSGAFLNSAVRLGVDAEGVEPAALASRSAIAAGLMVHCGEVQTLNLPAESFDVVTLFEVIEHLKAPEVVLREAFRLLRPCGVMMIGTGNTDSWTAKTMASQWEYFQIERHGGHVSFFNPHSLTKLVHQVGFKVIEVTTRRVQFSEKGRHSTPIYRLSKLCAELLNMPAGLLRKGHDMSMIMQKLA